MRVTIVVDDDLVIVDGVGARVDCRPLIGELIHAVQWYDDKGEIEFRSKEFLGDREPNERISDFTPFDGYVAKWKVQRETDERIAREQQKRMEEIGNRIL